MIVGEAAFVLDLYFYGENETRSSHRHTLRMCSSDTVNSLSLNEWRDIEEVV